jgi:hypothetical protein
MASTCLGVTERKDTTLIGVRHTPPDDLIRTVLKQVRIVKDKPLRLD